MTLSELKKLRKSKSVSQVDVAVAVGVSLMSYQLWERGVTKPKPENMKGLEEFFDVKFTA